MHISQLLRPAHVHPILLKASSSKLNFACELAIAVKDWSSVLQTMWAQFVELDVPFLEWLLGWLLRWSVLDQAPRFAVQSVRLSIHSTLINIVRYVTTSLLISRSFKSGASWYLTSREPVKVISAWLQLNNFSMEPNSDRKYTCQIFSNVY